MAVEFVGGSSGESDSSNLLLHAPTNTQVDDIVVVAIFADNAVTMPSGWTLAQSNEIATIPYEDQVLYWKKMTAADMSAWPLNFYVGSSTKGWVAAAYRGADTVTDAAGWASGGAVTTAFLPGVDVTAYGSLEVGVLGTGRSIVPNLPVEYLSRVTVLRDYLTPYRAVRLGDRAASPPAAGGAQVAVTSGTYIGQVLVIAPANVAPAAPVPVSPISGASVNRLNPITLSATFVDPGDSPSASRWRWRPVGTTTWTEVQQDNPLQTYPIAAGLAADEYEWQAAYADQSGVWGPYCSSEFFTATQPPPGPVFLDPVDGQTIPMPAYTATISALSVDESEWALRADDAGSPGLVLQGPESDTTGDLRSHTFSGLENGTVAWWSVRVKFSGLWSQPVEIRTPVSYTPPAAPVVNLTPDPGAGALVVGITNPAPTGNQPTATYNVVEINDGDGWETKYDSSLLPANTAYIYWQPVSDRDYGGNVRVTAVAENGVTAATTTTSTTEPPVEGFYGGY